MSSGIFVDLSPLRKFPQFRRLWIGYFVRTMGAQLTFVTVIYQTYEITHSNLLVGLLSLTQVIPGTLVPTFAGSIIDAMDRRKLLIITAILIGLATTVLAVNSIGVHPALWVLFVMSGLIWALNGFDAPARVAANVSLVDRDAITSTTILRQVTANTCQVAGPALSGVLIAAFSHNIDIVYWIDVASCIWALQTLIRIQPLKPLGGGRKFGLASVIEGFQFLNGRRVIQACFITDINANLLGLPISLFPYMATVHFHGGARAFGLLSAAPGIGSLGSTVFSGWIGYVRFKGRAVLVAVTIWGVAIAGFGVVPWLFAGVILLAVAGAADSTSASLRTSIIQLETPDHLRGRLSALSTATFQVGKLGNTEAGIVASLSNAQVSIVSGGFGCVLGVLMIARFIPSYAKYETAEP